MRKLLLILLCFPFLVFSQDEKRLALVIGNANYNKGELKNPVNDALLIAETLKKLEFDVVLDTNLANKSDFINAVMEFGDRRADYDVAFVYYAGHGIQVGAENYLLPTQVDFQKETDVRMKALAVQDIMMYLTGMTNQVNILILDACRDNPFEGNWNKTRSLKGSGLAKMKAPTGSLIAFSTTAGSTAADGDGENSIYCSSLVKNMMFDGISLDQVFRNVRAEVFKLTNGNQQTEEATQLTGETFYLVISDFKKEFEQISSMYDKEEYYNALEITNKIIVKDPTNFRAYNERGYSYYYLKQYDKAEENFTKAIDLDPEDGYAYRMRRYVYESLEQYDKAEADYTKVIVFDSLNTDGYMSRAHFYRYSKLKKHKEAAKDYIKVIELNPVWIPNKNFNEWQNPYVLLGDLYFENLVEAELKPHLKAIEWYSKAIEVYSKEDKQLEAINFALGYALHGRANGFLKNKEYDKAEADYTKAIELKKEDDFLSGAYQHRADFYFEIEQYEKAEADYTKAIYIGEALTLKGRGEEIGISDMIGSYLLRGYFYKETQNYIKAILDYTKVLELDPENTKAYHNRAVIYKELEQYAKAEKDYTNFLLLVPKDANLYYTRANLYVDLEQYDKALADYTKAIDLDSENSKAYSSRGEVYERLEQYKKAEVDYTKAIELDTENLDYYNYRASIYSKLELYNKAEADYAQIIAIDPEEVYYGYCNRATLYSRLEQYDKALADYNEAIELRPKETAFYPFRAMIYSTLGQHEKAILDYTKAIELNDQIGNNSAIIWSRANCHKRLGQYDKALADYTKAIETDHNKNVYMNNNKKKIRIYQDRLTLYLKLGDLQKAEDDCNAIIKIDPKDPEAYFYLSIIFNLQDKNVAAIDMLSTSMFRLLDGNYIGDNGMGIKSFEGDDIELKDIYIKRGEIYQSMNIDRFMCNDFKKACDLGDCEMFDTHCK